MYTTLALLRASSACTHGYGTQLKFWGTSPEVKEQRIPLHVLLLVSDEDDTQWALENGFIISPSEFKEFQERMLPVIWRSQLWEQDWQLDEKPSRIKKAPKISKSFRSKTDQLDDLVQKEYREKAWKATTTADILRIVEEARFYVRNHWFHRMVRESWLQEPVQFIKMVFASNINEYALGKELPSTVKDKKTRLAMLIKPVDTFDFIFTMKFKEKALGSDFVIDREKKQVSMVATDAHSAFSMIQEAFNREKIIVNQDWIDNVDPDPDRMEQISRRRARAIDDGSDSDMSEDD